MCHANGGRPRITLQPLGMNVEARAQETVLDALLRHRLRVFRGIGIAP